MPRIAIVILNWNGLGFLREFLGTVVRHSYIPSAEIYVADNGSADGSANWIEENFKSIKLLRFDTNHGFAEGYNLALDKIDAEYYILLNSDVEVTEGWLTPMISYLEKNPGAASCQPKILSYNRRDQFEYAGAAGGFIDKYGYPFCRGRIFDNVEKDLGQYNDSIDIFWSTGACMAVRASAWKRCGGFDASFFAHMEEIDLCWRFHRVGYKVSYIPESVVFHVGGGSLHYDSPFKTYLNFRNSLFLLYKNIDDKDLDRVLFIRRVLDGFAAVTFFFKGGIRNLRSVWKAHMDFYKSMDELKLKRRAVKELGNNNFKAPVLNKSIVFEFYARGRKTFDRLGFNFLK